MARAGFWSTCCILIIGAYQEGRASWRPGANAKDLLALLRTSPGTYTLSSSGADATTNLIVEARDAAVGIKAVYVP